jgi:hypothetical protein
MGEEREAYKALVGKHDGKRPLGRLRSIEGCYSLVHTEREAAMLIPVGLNN